MCHATKSFFLSPEIHTYLVAHGSPPGRLEQALIEETRQLGPASLMQISPEQGAFLTLLARAVGARRAIEVGTFTGYSTLCLARGLPDDGTLLSCDVSETWTTIARRYWEKAELQQKIELRIGPAAETLRDLPETPEYDLGFIDADKESYVLYYEEILKRLRPNGLVLVDNVLWFGRVADDGAQDSQTQHIRAFNEHVARDARAECVMLAISDGLSLIRKR
jgi:caffeoyl-CoA O-methyltransferase